MRIARTQITAGWWMAFGIGAGLVLLISLPPFVSEGVRGVLMQAFSAVCHQIPGRSPHLDGVSLAVCHRCYGIYWGLPLAALIYLGFREPRVMAGRRPLLLGLSLVPMVVDWGGDALGLFANTPGSRLATGLVFGLVAGWMLVLAFHRNRSA